MSGTNVYATYMAPAFIGMKADSMDDNVDTFACGATPVNLGVAVKRTAAAAPTVTNGGDAALCVGIALHDHIIGYYGTYRQYDAVSVLTRGRAWVALSSGTGVADGVIAKADATTGQFNTTGVTIPNAVFRSGAIILLGIDGVTTTLGAIVELHSPWIDNIGASV